MNIIDEDQTKTKMRQYVKSREWWILIGVGGTDIIGQAFQLIEERHYSGEANGDFHVVLGGGLGMVPFAFAKKTRVSAADIEQTLIEAGAVIAPGALEHGERDILSVCFIDDGDDMGYVAQWAAWLGI